MTEKGQGYFCEQVTHYINRELSWLEFNDRVLKEAKDQTNPILERAKFFSIVSSNLDEFFMVRVASLKDQVNAAFNKVDPAGLTPSQQLYFISKRVHRMVTEQYHGFNLGVRTRLRENGIHIKRRKELNEVQRAYVKDYFQESVYPLLKFMLLIPEEPFPLVLNKVLNLGVILADKGEKEKISFATVQVPQQLSRFLILPSESAKIEIILLEDVICRHLAQIFPGKKVVAAYPYRVTRNADLGIEEEEAEDLLMVIEKSLLKRKWAETVRLEVDQKIDRRLETVLKHAFEVEDQDIYYITGPLDLTFLMQLYGIEKQGHLKYEKQTPSIPRAFGNKARLFQVIQDTDVLLHHPYDSFRPVVDFVKKAALDPAVLSIKQTLYRVSGNSPIIKALAKAATMGKQVTVLVELKARFDEEINIQWAKHLERAGCHVIYGFVGLKTHCKLTMVVRQETHAITRYVHIGTGNYNDVTARFYTDMGLFTSNPAVGSDVAKIFNWLSGYSDIPDLEQCTLSPLGLREKFMTLIEGEIKAAQNGKAARIIAKMNSLVDVHLIDALYKASQAGVKIDLIVRGICCLRPGIGGLSENIEVRSIVGRFLEHSRIYYFANEQKAPLYLSSADWMPRNLNRRVELLYPVSNFEIREKILETLEIELKDNIKARILQGDGTYEKVKRRGKRPIHCQMTFTQAHQSSKKPG